MLSSLQLAQEAKDYNFNTAIPLRIYLKTCVGILDKAQLSFQSGDIAMSFKYYYRYVDLCTNKLSKHPEFLISGKPNSDPELKLYRQEYLQLIKLEVPAVLRIIEDLKKKIDLDWEKHQVSLARNIARSPMNHTHNNNNNNILLETKKDKTILPPTFNEHNFQQSLAFLQNSSINTSSVNSKPINPEKLVRKTSNSSNTASATTSEANTDANHSTALNHYPELPQLSFLTF